MADWAVCLEHQCLHETKHLEVSPQPHLVWEPDGSRNKRRVDLSRHFPLFLTSHSFLLPGAGLPLSLNASIKRD